MRSVSAKYTAAAAATASALTYNIPALIVTFLAPTPTLQCATRSNVAICWISQHGINSVTTNSKEWRGSTLGFDAILLYMNTILPFLVKEKASASWACNALISTEFVFEHFTFIPYNHFLWKNDVKYWSKFTVYIIYVVFWNNVPHKWEPDVEKKKPPNSL